jgi:hypothetical protein
MDRPTDDEPKGSSDSASGRQDRRRTRRRTRTLLNLGMPFIQVDEFLNQSEDAVALGYRVLEDTVKEIQAGYEEAKKFNKDMRNWAATDGKRPAPPIPWEQLVDRAQRFQDIALQTVKEGTDILFDSIRSGTNSMKNIAQTWQQSRADVDDTMPVLAGPVFEEPIVITTWFGAGPKEATREIPHRGLARLRIYPEVKPELKILKRVDDEWTRTLVAPAVTHVSFEPSEDKPDVSVLKVAIGAVAQQPDRPAVTYEGLIRAKNFELLIAKLRVVVLRERLETRSPEAIRTNDASET